jgi:hypothetical protein
VCVAIGLREQNNRLTRASEGKASVDLR